MIFSTRIQQNHADVEAIRDHCLFFRTITNIHNCSQKMENISIESTSLVSSMPMIQLSVIRPEIISVEATVNM